MEEIRGCENVESGLELLKCEKCEVYIRQTGDQLRRQFVE